MKTISFSEEIKILQKRRAGMIDYLKLKLEDEDWHGVMDASADIREIDVEIEVYTKLNHP